MDDDLRTQLLSALAAGTSGNVALQGLLSQLGDADPTVGLLAQYLAQRQAQESSGEDNVDSEFPGDSAGSEQSREMAQALDQLRGNVNDMYSELQILRERNDALAAALGACHLCWGDDLECPVCRGRGLPGYFLPDSEMFLEYVAPASRTLQNWRTADKRFIRNGSSKASSS
jgi:hypothetical protein